MSFSIKSDSGTQNSLSPFYKSEQGNSSSQSLLFPLFNSEQGSSSSQSLASPVYDNKQKSLPLIGRCLVVDDNKTNRAVMVATLRKLGIKADQAENGEEALKRLKSNEKYDFAIFDNSMPVMNGTEAVRRYRSEGDNREKTPIIGWTTDGAKIEEQFIEEGAVATLKKPLNKQNIEKVLSDENLLPLPQTKTKKNSKSSKTKKKKTSSKEKRKSSSKLEDKSAAVTEIKMETKESSVYNKTDTIEPTTIKKIRSAGDKIELPVMNEKTEENSLKKVFSSE